MTLSGIGLTASNNSTGISSLWQQALGLDARYNAYRAPNNPQFRTLYIRRRSQLLREKCKQDPSNSNQHTSGTQAHTSTRRQVQSDTSSSSQGGTQAQTSTRGQIQSDTSSSVKEYIKIRSELLSQRYGTPSFSDQSSLRSRTISNRSASRNTLDSLDVRFRPDLTLGRRYGDVMQRLTVDGSVLGVVPTNIADASRAMVGDKSIGENYQFSGVHHIFDQHKAAVTSVKFAHDDKSRMACCSADGQISVCQLVPTPATVICVLQGHTAAVCDFVWSLSNDSILSCSVDGTVRLWQVASGSCLRVIINPAHCEINACIFQPVNNNLFVTGDSKRNLQVMNLSTGKGVKGGSSTAAGSVLCLAFDTSGRLLWSGDDRGHVFSFIMDVASGKLTRAKRVVVCDGHAVTCLSVRAWISREARDPCLLVNCRANALCLYRIVSEDGNIELKRKFPIKQRTLNIRSTFCPLISFLQGACVVSGSEDSCVYFFDVERGDASKSCINTLQGHSAPVLDVSFCHDESLLASCDMQGTVIVWKRELRRTAEVVG